MTTGPTTPRTQPLPGITRTQFSLLRFRSPLLTEYLFLRVLRCFTSPRSPQRPINSSAGNQTQLWPGFPIRTPSDHSSFANSPRLIAGHHVLHRLLMPRHPPCAHKHFTTTKQHTENKDARVHYTVLKQPTHTHQTRPQRATQQTGPQENHHTGDSPTTQQHAISYKTFS